MYLNTRRYRNNRRRGLRVGRLLFWIVVPLLIVVGIGIYENRTVLAPVINTWMNTMVEDAANTVATIQAPPPTPTRDASSILLRAQNAWSQGLFQDAVRLYEESLSAVPNRVDVYYQYTRGLIMQDRLSEAVIAAENTVTANPFSSDAWAIRALALALTGQHGEAIASGLHALELSRDNPSAHSRARAFLAIAYFEAGMGNRALAEVERALEEDPDNYEAHYVRGYLTPLVTFENFEAAREDLEIAYDRSNGMIDAGVVLANEYIYRLEDTESGLALLRELSDRNPDTPLILYELGRYYYRQLGDLNQAATVLNRCVASVPDHSNCNYELGRVQYQQADITGASESFARAVDGGSQSPYHFYWAGRTQAELGNCPAALEFLSPGRDLATRIEISDEALLALYDEQLSQCGVFTFDPAVGANEITPEVTPEPQS